MNRWKIGRNDAFAEKNLEECVFKGSTWRYIRKWISIVSFLLCLINLSSCAANPTQNIVTSKNDGAFDSKIQQTAPVQETEGIVMNRNGSFSSTDGSVEYIWNIYQTVFSDPMPVVEVVPHYFTGDDIHRIASVLFGNAVFCDLGPESELQFSRTEIQRKLNLLTKYSSEESFSELYISNYWNVSKVQNLIEDYTLQYETAPEESSFAICDWTLKKESYYKDSGNYGMSDGNNNQLNIITTIENRDYTITANIRNDYMRNYLSVDIGDGTGHIMRSIQYEELCATEAPTQEQIESALTIAQTMLDQMDLGQFMVVEGSVSSTNAGAAPGYLIRVKAIPVIEGVPGLLGHTGVTYVNTDLTVESYAPNYAMANVEFTFNADGILVSFTMDGITEVKEVININVATLPIDELFAKSETYLSLFDAASFDSITGNNIYSVSVDHGVTEDSIALKVEITGVQYGLARINVPNSDDSFYYTPAMLFEGTISYYDKDTGELIDSITKPLFTINAVDGTII